MSLVKPVVITMVYLSRKELVKERGWPKRTVKQLLPGNMDPDGYRPAQQQGNFATPVCRLSRIQQLEAEHGIGYMNGPPNEPPGLPTPAVATESTPIGADTQAAGIRDSRDASKSGGGLFLGRARVGKRRPGRCG